MINAIAGYITFSEKRSKDYLGKMSEKIKHSPTSDVKTWRDNYLSISQSSYEKIKKSYRPVVNKEKTILLVMIGEINCLTFCLLPVKKKN